MDGRWHGGGAVDDAAVDAALTSSGVQPQARTHPAATEPVAAPPSPRDPGNPSVAESGIRPVIRLQEIAAGTVMPRRIRRAASIGPMTNTSERLRQIAGRRVGRVIAGRYPLMKLIGVGSAAAVYEATDRITGMSVAIKVLHDELRASEEHLVRIRREATAAAEVDHPGVVTVLDAGCSDGSPYIVFELLDGTPLAAVMSQGRQRADDVVTLGLQLLAVLDAVHARGIIHRDIKPENIYLEPESGDGSGGREGWSIRLLDFGVAKLPDGDDLGGFSTQAGATLGTPRYMSPEQCCGRGASPQSDIWSAAALLFHAFAGAPPFEAAHVPALLLKILHEPPPRLRDRRPDLPAGLCWVIDHAMEAEPAQRWRSAGQMRDALVAASSALTSSGR